MVSENLIPQSFSQWFENGRYSSFDGCTPIQNVSFTEAKMPSRVFFGRGLSTIVFTTTHTKEGARGTIPDWPLALCSLCMLSRTFLPMHEPKRTRNLPIQSIFTHLFCWQRSQNGWPALFFHCTSKCFPDGRVSLVRCYLDFCRFRSNLMRSVQDSIATAETCKPLS